MSNTDNTDSEADRQPQFTLDGFAAASVWLTAAADPRGTAKRLRQLERAQSAVDSARADLSQQSTAFREEMAAKQAELEAGAKANSDKAVVLHVAEGDLRRREATLAADREELVQRDNRSKRRLMMLAGIEEPGPLQTMPTWRELAGELLAIERDPHFPAAESETIETVRPDYVPAASTLTQSRAVRRRAGASVGA